MSRDLARARAQQLGDVHGRKQPEKLSEYFAFDVWPEKAELKVTRHELSVILQQYDRARKAMTPWGRVKLAIRGIGAYLSGRVGSPKPEIEAVPTKPAESAP